MSRKWVPLVLLLVGMATDLVHGQLPYSSNSPAYEVPPLGVIHEYQRQLEDDIYAVERKAELIGHRECVAGKENFLFCPLTLNVFDFAVCTLNPGAAQGADALTRGIKFPSSAFSQTPSVAVGISGIATGPTCDVKVEAQDVYASGFNIKLSGSFLFYPRFIDVIWIACPVRQKVNTTVRDFVPKKGVPPPPYFPINYASGSSSKPRSNTSSNGNNLVYDNNQPRFADNKPRYEESSALVDEDTDDNEKPSPKEKAKTLYKSSTSSYVKSTPEDDADKPRSKDAAADDDSQVDRDTTEAYRKPAPEDEQ
ncbi:hypothetical protein BsWGS_21840 [Bradybaena similaris]